MNPILLRSRALFVLVAFLVSSAPPQVPARSAENQRGSSPNSSVQTFVNTTAITINDDSTATPYPSTITVSGVNPASVTHVRVVLYGFTHSFPDDVDIVLVGPQGQRAILMSDAGGGNGVSGLQFAFEQTATATTLPDETALTGGGTTYRPANYVNGGGADNFPAPGPGELNFAPADLSVFSATNPNGVWSLYVVDAVFGDAGAISEGWDLVITVPTVFTVTNTNDSGAGSLRDAITAAQNGDLINFSALFDTPQTINLLSALPDITKSVTIQGPGAHLLTVRRDYNAPNFRIFNILNSIANGVAISGLTISNGHSGLFGGGISSQSRLTLMNVDVTGNQASSGGGVSLSGADGTFAGCTFSANTVVGSGGAIFYEGDGGFTLRLANSTVSGNRAGDGGIVNVSNSGQSRLEVTSCTIVNNAAGSSGLRTLASGASNNATTTLRNSIIASNTPANLGSQATGGGTTTVTTLGFNLSDDFNVIAPAGSDIATATPRLGPLSRNAGATPTHALLGGSPALNAGEASGLATDQRGVPRVFGASADIGAVEMQAIIVSNANDGGGGSLRQAIADADNNGAGLDDIIFDNAVFSTAQIINLQTVLPDITSSLTINGPGASLLTVRRSDEVSDFGIFNIPGGVSGGVAISGTTIANGRSTGSGGGIASDSPLTLTNVHVSGNQAFSGGGIFLRSDGVFNGCTFSGNRADGSGGGIYFEGGGRTLRLVNSTVSGNSAGSAIGGIVNISSSGNNQLEVVNSTIAGNTAPNLGALTTVTQFPGTTASTTLRNTIVAGNSPANLATATYFGGLPTVTSFGFNLANDNGGGFLTGPGDKVNVFAGLGPLQNNGGPTPTQALLRNSAALDAGNNSATLFDQRGPGFARTTDYTNISNVSDGTDIGAIEGTALTFTSITRLPGDGHILLQGFGAPGLIYNFEGSGDPRAANGMGLVGSVIPDGTGAFSFNDANMNHLTKRFYRAYYP